LYRERDGVVVILDGDPMGAGHMVSRRKIIAALAVPAAALPLAARAQQGEHMRRIGVLLSDTEGDTESQVRVSAFEQALAQLGWLASHNVRIDYRWMRGEYGRASMFAKELVQLDCDVIVGQTTASALALKQQTKTIPIVIVQVTDPVRAGLVTSLAHPDGNITGMAMYETDIATKWLELLKEIAPGIIRIAILFNPETAPGGGSFYLRSIEAASRSFAVAPLATPVQDIAGIERAFDVFARQSNGGLLVTPDATTTANHKLIAALAARHRLPAIYPYRFFAADGGLISYGSDSIDLFRRAASYVDRILKGEEPANLPIQAPTKFELVVNLKTAKALGLTVPYKLLATADEVIE
jgi:putative tryptophan/tyrosine transport system substrate-binding protein